MIGFAKMNGLDIYSTYGISFRPGTYDELLKAPKRKKAYEYDWKDESGIETDPNEMPVYERQVFNLPIVIIAENGEQFYHRYGELTTFLLNSKEINLDFIEMGRRFKLQYAEMSDFQKLTKISGTSLVGCYFTIQFTNDYPTQKFTID